MSVSVGALAWAPSYHRLCRRIFSTSTQCKCQSKRPAMLTLQAFSLTQAKKSHSSLEGLSAPHCASSCRFMIMSSTGSLDPLVGSLSWPPRLRRGELRLACTCLLRRFTSLVHCDLHWSMATPTNVRAVLQDRP